MSDITFTSKELSLNIQQFSDMVLQPAMKQAAREMLAAKRGAKRAKWREAKRKQRARSRASNGL